MSSINVIHSELNIVSAIYSLEASVLDLENKAKNNPERIASYQPFIDGMNKHITGLREALVTIRMMEREILSIKASLYATNKINLELKFENEKLVKRNEELLKFI